MQCGLSLLTLVRGTAVSKRSLSIGTGNTAKPASFSNAPVQVRRLTHKERVQRRMERRRERADFSEKTGALPDPRQIMDKLRYMAEGHVLYADGAAQHVIEDYLATCIQFAEFYSLSPESSTLPALSHQLLHSKPKPSTREALPELSLSSRPPDVASREDHPAPLETHRLFRST